jgi:hypothetical protein
LSTGKKNAKENQSVETKAQEKEDPTTVLSEIQEPSVMTSGRHILEDLNTTTTSCLFLLGLEESYQWEAILNYQPLLTSFFNLFLHV